MTTIIFSVKDQAITLVSTPVVASGGVNDTSVHFEFSSDWDAFSTKQAAFYKNETEGYAVLLDENNECNIPREILSYNGVVYMGVMGSKGAEFKTSEIIPYRIVEGAYSPVAVGTPTLDIYRQLLNKIQALGEGGPRGGYSTVAQLESADPDHDYTYVVAATNKWYYYGAQGWTPGGDYLTNLLIDDKLEKEGWSADAKATGAAIANLDNKLLLLLSVDPFPNHLGQIQSGSIVNGDIEPNASRARTVYINLSTSYITEIFFDDEVSSKYRIFTAWKYTAQGIEGEYSQFVFSTDLDVKDHLLIVTDQEHPYIRITFAKADATETITADEREEIRTHLMFRRLTDRKLEQPGKPADALATGEAISNLADKAFNIMSIRHTTKLNYGGLQATTGTLLYDRPDRLRTSPFETSYYHKLKIYVDNSEIEDTQKHVSIMNAFKYATSDTPTSLTPGIKITTNRLNSDDYLLYECDLDYPFIRISFAKEDGSDFNDTELNWLASNGLRIETFNAEAENLSNLLSEAQRLALHSVPENDGVLNAIKNVRHITDVKWTPGGDTIRYQLLSDEEGSNRYEDVYKAGVEYTGVPYSSSSWRFVGIYRTFETFVTAASDPRSAQIVLSKFIRNSQGAITNWIKALFYGNVCCHVPCYAFGWESISSQDFANCPLLDFKFDIYDSTSDEYNNLKTLKLADVLVAHSGSHIRMVTDIEKDSDGNVVRVEVSEQTPAGTYSNHIKGGQYGGGARRKFFTKDEFLNANRNYAIYRYPEIASVQYRYTPYVSNNEGSLFPVIYMPCMPFEGNNTWFKISESHTAIDGSEEIAGNIVQILINAEGFKKLRVQKNGELFAEYDLTVTSQEALIQASTVDPDSDPDQWFTCSVAFQTPPPKGQIRVIGDTNDRVYDYGKKEVLLLTDGVSTQYSYEGYARDVPIYFDSADMRCIDVECSDSEEAEYTASLVNGNNVTISCGWICLDSIKNRDYIYTPLDNGDYRYTYSYNTIFNLRIPKQMVQNRGAGGEQYRVMPIVNLEIEEISNGYSYKFSFVKPSSFGPASKFNMYSQVGKYGSINSEHVHASFVSDLTSIATISSGNHTVTFAYPPLPGELNLENVNNEVVGVIESDGEARVYTLPGIDLSSVATIRRRNHRYVPN